MQNPTVNFVFV